LCIVGMQFSAHRRRHLSRRAGGYGPRMARGRLITVEGIDGAGKTTLVAGIAEALPHLVVLREPGGVEVSERLRDLLADPELSIAPRTEALLYAASRAQLVSERLEPLLAAGESVLLDRFVDSSLAYQGGGRLLGVHLIRTLNEFATAGLVPDRTLLLQIDPDDALPRTCGIDRLEHEDRGFFQAVATTYAELAQAEPDRFVVLDATAPPEAVLERALAAL
jgi:dTMP kinase